MINKIKILSPGQGCWKTKKIIKYLRTFFLENNIQAEFVIITELEEFLKYETWILPTIVINDKIVARGYKPSKDTILKSIK